MYCDSIPRKKKKKKKKNNVEANQTASDEQSDQGLHFCYLVIDLVAHKQHDLKVLK